MKKINSSLFKSTMSKFASGVTIITIDQFFKFGLKKSMDIAKDVIGKSDTYLSFDIDGIDPT